MFLTIQPNNAVECILKYSRMFKQGADSALQYSAAPDLTVQGSC